MSDNPKNPKVGTCRVCGHPIYYNESRLLDNSAHGYCYDFNKNYALGKSKAHIQNPNGNTVVPEIDSEGYLTGNYKNKN